MSLRELLKARPEDVKVKPENDALICIYSDGAKKYIPSPVIHNGKVYKRTRVGRGRAIEKGGMFGGEGDTWTEYERYEEVLIPVFNGNLVSVDAKKEIANNEELILKYANEHPETILSLGDNPGGKRVVWESELEADERLRKQQEQYDNLHIEVRHSQGNLMFGTHHVLSCRVPREVWEKIKHYFRYVDTEEFNDEVWGASFKGYEILPGKIEELENLLEIPIHLRFAKLQEDEKKRKEEEAKKNHELQQFKAEIEKEFSYKNTIPHDIPQAEKIRLEGEEVPYMGIDSRIYGGGEWFIVQEDYIWRVINNGMDGDDWSKNNIMTGGAGAIGYKFEKTARRMELLDRLKKEGGF